MYVINYRKLILGESQISKKINTVIKFIHENAAIELSGYSIPIHHLCMKKIDIFMKCLYSNSFILDSAKDIYIK